MLEPPVSQSHYENNRPRSGLHYPLEWPLLDSHFHSIQGSGPNQVPEGSRLTVGQLVSIRQPVYPVEAAREHVEGTVHLRAVVDQLGKVEAIHLVSGPPILVPAAIDAVHEWRYGPTILGGKAVESVEDIIVVFRLANSVASPR